MDIDTAITLSLDIILHPCQTDLNRDFMLMSLNVPQQTQEQKGSDITSKLENYTTSRQPK